jgi:hypothetical protein
MNNLYTRAQGIRAMIKGRVKCKHVNIISEMKLLCKYMDRHAKCNKDLYKRII